MKTTKGTRDDPVKSDPFQTILKIHWAGGDWFFVRVRPPVNSDLVATMRIEFPDFPDSNESASDGPTRHINPIFTLPPEETPNGYRLKDADLKGRIPTTSGETVEGYKTYDWIFHGANPAWVTFFKFGRTLPPGEFILTLRCTVTGGVIAPGFPGQWKIVMIPKGRLRAGMQVMSNVPGSPVKNEIPIADSLEIDIDEPGIHRVKINPSKETVELVS